MKLVLKIIGFALLGVVALAVLLIGYLSITEYRPKDREVILPPAGSGAKPAGEELTLLSFNTGYAGLDAGADFFMDGGTKVNPESRDKVTENMAAISKLLVDNPADIYLLQEVDRNSARTYAIDQTAYYANALGGYGGAFAMNYKCSFVPFPLPPIGRVESGVYTLSALCGSEAARIALPCPFAWPVRTANLKRCLLETRFLLADGARELVVFNLHLEAYDSGEGKEAQTKMLMGLLQAEYEKGNYVIAGGDFNQTFPGSLAQYPILEDDYWLPGVLEEQDMPEGFRFAFDAARPTCRLLNAPYDPETSQFYILDGFILSENVDLIAVQAIDTGFMPSDHQPIQLKVRLTDG